MSPFSISATRVSCPEALITKMFDIERSFCGPGPDADRAGDGRAWRGPMAPADGGTKAGNKAGQACLPPEMVSRRSRAATPAAFLNLPEKPLRAARECKRRRLRTVPSAPGSGKLIDVECAPTDAALRRLHGRPRARNVRNPPAGWRSGGHTAPHHAARRQRL